MQFCDFFLVLKREDIFCFGGKQFYFNFCLTLLLPFTTFDVSMINPLLQNTLEYHVFENIMENGALDFNVMFVLLLTLVLVQVVKKTSI